MNKTDHLRNIADGYYLFLLLFVSTRVLDFLDTGDLYSLKRGSDVRNCQR